MTPTAAIAAIREAVEREFPEVTSLGVFNMRPIAGSLTPSQHASANAWDIGAPDDEQPSTKSNPSPTLDAVYAWLVAMRNAGLLPIGLILWRTSAHWDHIHVEGDPKVSGYPDGWHDVWELNATGTRWVRKSTERGEGMEDPLTKIWQEIAIEVGFDPGPADGVPGPKTKNGLLELTRAMLGGGTVDVDDVLRQIAVRLGGA